MCIAVLSFQHPDYPLILIDNRDVCTKPFYAGCRLTDTQEYLARPTLDADWWGSPNSHVLGGRDLARPEQGTWIGITKDGRVAALTNFREEGEVQIHARSRGAIMNAYLTQPRGPERTTEAFVKELAESEEALVGVGGFNLLCGKVGEPFAVISNRTPDSREALWFRPDGTGIHGLSNALVTNRSWAKVPKGEYLVQEAIKSNVEVQASKESLIAALFDILSLDTLPRDWHWTEETGWKCYGIELKSTIFVPTLASGQDLDSSLHNGQIIGDGSLKNIQGSGAYGTMKQTVILVDRQGHVTFIERSLYDKALQPTDFRNQDRSFEFDIEEWAG